MASKFAIPVDFPDPYVATDETQEADTDEDENAKPGAVVNPPGKQQQPESIFQSADYLDQWVTGREPSENKEEQDLQDFNWDMVYSSSPCLSALPPMLSLATISFLFACQIL